MWMKIKRVLLLLCWAEIRGLTWDERTSYFLVLHRFPSVGLEHNFLIVALLSRQQRINAVNIFVIIGFSDCL